MNARFVGQFHEDFMQRMHHRLRVAGGKIDATDRTRKQCVANDRFARLRAPQRDAARGMSRRMKDAKVILPELQELSVADVGIGSRRAH